MGNGFYILDEPEAALSPVSQMSLLIRINQLANLNSQFIIATYSPILLAIFFSILAFITPLGQARAPQCVMVVLSFLYVLESYD